MRHYTNIDAATASQPADSSNQPRLVKHTRKYLYGLNIEPPWPDGGFIEANIPEHLQVCPAGTEIVGEAEGDGPSRWVVADDGRSAALDVVSTRFPGVRARCDANVKGHSIVFSLRVDNNGKADLPLLKVLACHRYRRLTGFAPGSDPLTHTLVMIGGKFTRLADVPTTRPDSIIKGAFVATRAQRDPSIAAFTGGFGGYIPAGVDAAVIAVVAGDGEGRHKVVLSWAPGKSILANGQIPCFHADLHLGVLPAGRSTFAHGVMLFSDKPLAAAVEELLAALAAAGPPGSATQPGR